MRRWLITGGCGFIGCNLVRHLLAEGGRLIRVLDNLEVGRAERLRALAPVVEVAPATCSAPSDDRIELVVGDILDADVVRASTHGCEVLVHLAANTGVALSVQDPRRDCLVNVVGTLNCLEAARHERVGASCSPRPALRSARSSRRCTRRRRRTRYSPTARASSAAKAIAPPTSEASASRPWPCASATSMARDPTTRAAWSPPSSGARSPASRSRSMVTAARPATSSSSTIWCGRSQGRDRARHRGQGLSHRDRQGDHDRRAGAGAAADPGAARLHRDRAAQRPAAHGRRPPQFRRRLESGRTLGVAGGSASGRGPRSRRTLVYAAGRGQSRHAGAGAGRSQSPGADRVARIDGALDPAT